MLCHVVLHEGRIHQKPVLFLGTFLRCNHNHSQMDTTCLGSIHVCHCKHLNSELGAQTVLHLSVSKGVIQRKRESWSSATSSSNDNNRPSPMAQAVHTGMKYILFT